MQDSQERAKFTAMAEGTQEDWAIIGGQFMGYAAGLADRVLAHLKLLDGDFGGFPIDRLQHSLQTATRAHRDQPWPITKRMVIIARQKVADLARDPRLLRLLTRELVTYAARAWSTAS